jgi:hypothetical protein
VNVLALLFFGLTAGFSTTGDPDAPEQPIVWPDPTITVSIHPDGSDDISDGSDIAAIRAALEAWSAPPCTNLALVDGGFDSNKTNADDGVNRIFFVESNWPSEFAGAAAVTISRVNAGSPDTWRDADILINGAGASWSTTGEVHRHDVQSVVTHELGHLLGLKHAAHPEATMYFVNPPGTTHRRTLHPSDVSAVCWLYPAVSPPMCAGDEDCPAMVAATGGGRARYTCSNGQCIIGQAGYGNECFSDGQCRDGLCTRDPDTADAQDPGFCTRACPCPGGDLCSAGSCVLGRDDCVADPDCGGGSNDKCAVDLDGRRRCIHLCLQDRHCPMDQVCHGGTGANPPGFCRTPGPGLDGDACDDGLDCASLTCAGAGLEPTCLGGPPPPADAGLNDDTGAADAPNADAPVNADAARPDATDPTDAGIAEAGSADASGPPEELSAGCGCSSTAPRAELAWFVLACAVVLRLRSRR